MAATKLHALGLTSDWDIAVHFCAYLAARLYSSIDDPRFKINKFSGDEFEEYEFMNRAQEVVRQLATMS